ncbi:hypothetical protein DPMN_102266 [Dreissena polymorpha]|uniref:Uncharacterized protein n=1 Tax=Dreissena polymorpha TaxID=45954 RepID=A0A9D4LML4_DREPO|nr:hypothetical protein DPMN_102266 [Dreissena polymorpha]
MHLPCGHKVLYYVQPASPRPQQLACGLAANEVAVSAHIKQDLGVLHSRVRFPKMCQLQAWDSIQTLNNVGKSSSLRLCSIICLN